MMYSADVSLISVKQHCSCSRFFFLPFSSHMSKLIKVILKCNIDWLFQPPGRIFFISQPLHWCFWWGKTHLLKSTALCQCFRRIFKDLILIARFAVFLKVSTLKQRLYICIYIYIFSSGFFRIFWLLLYLKKERKTYYINS